MNTESEIWKDIEQFEGYYQISNWGNVRSLSRQVSKYEFRPGKILKPKLQRNLYKVGLTSTTKVRRDYGSLAKPCVEYLAYKADISNIVCTFACKEYCNERESLYDAC